tara:strand:- start:3651 stop:4988 length:1338 start_codon:yes stop_codon:yes gene_type:complete
MASLNKYIKNSPNFVKKIYYKLVPFEKRYGREFSKTYDFLNTTLLWDKEKLKNHQFLELQRLIKKCYDYVPYYHKLMIDYGVSREIKDFEELSKLPILTKDIVRENWNDLIDKRYLKNSFVFKTSGSTGEKFKFLGNDNLYKREAAFVLRAFNLHGSSLYDNHTVWLRRYAPKAGEPMSFVDYELNRTYMSPFNVSDSTVKQYVKTIDDTKSETLVTYPSLANFLSIVMAKNNLRFKHIKSVHCASESVIPKWRENVRKNLGIELYAHYGMMEKVSFFCNTNISNGRYAESLEYGFTEFDKNTGSVIGTGFLNDVMPFIRYSPGDIAFPAEDIKYHGSLPISVNDFLGRKTDMITCIDGRSIPGVNFYTMMYKIKGVSMFQIVQKTLRDIEIRYIKSKDWSEKTDSEIKIGMKERVGNCNLKIVLVESFERAKNTGKFKTILNES